MNRPGADPCKGKKAPAEALHAHSDADASAPEWDAFLEETPLGQFQQSSKWGRVKAYEGWQVQRVLLSSAEGLLGGFQLLWRDSRFGRVGYLSKGPVLREESPAAVEAALNRVRAAAMQLRLRALVLQPPDLSRISPCDLTRHGFLDTPVPSIISATLLISLSEGYDAVLERMSRTMRQHGRQALKRGVLVNDAGAGALPQFFELMKQTCVRQGTFPNPARIEVLEAIGAEFKPHVRLALAQVNGTPVAGLFMIGFGNRLTFWKKGWNFDGDESRANSLLHLESLRWACAVGYRTVDFAACDRQLAESLLAGRPLSLGQQQSRHMFNLRLGASPRVLPPAHLLVLNRALRAIIGALGSLPTAWRCLFRTGGLG